MNARNFQLRRAFFEGDSKLSKAFRALLPRVGVEGPALRAFFAARSWILRSSIDSPDSARTRTLCPQTW